MIEWRLPPGRSTVGYAGACMCALCWQISRVRRKKQQAGGVPPAPAGLTADDPLLHGSAWC